MTEIPLGVKILHSMGFVKVKKVETKHIQDSGRVLPKAFQVNPEISTNPKNVKYIKLTSILKITTLSVMIIIPLAILFSMNHDQKSISSVPINEKFTDQQIIAKYPNLSDLDKALQSGELNIDQVSNAMKGMIKQQKLGPYHGT